MNGNAPVGGLKGYFGALVATVVFPLVWMRSVRLARRHTATDPRGPMKVGAAIVLGVLLAAGGTFLVLGFQDTAKAGMYDSMETRLAAAVGESEYAANQDTIAAADGAIPIIQGKLAEARAAGDEAKIAELETALNATKKQRDEAVAKVQELTPNHALFLRLQPMVEAQDDDAIRAEIADSGLAKPAGMATGAEGAFAIKDEAVSDMHLSLWLFVWPSLAGTFFAPLAFALGSILRSAFRESDSVGFKPYPGGAAGWFLLLGAFGVPAIPFAAWVFMDAEGRSVEGQIAL